MEQYIEQTVSCDRSGGKRAAYLLLCSAAVIFLLITAVSAAAAISNNADGSLKLNWIAVIAAAVSLILAVIAWIKKDNFCIDYDYAYFEGEISISAVYNSKRRKKLRDLKLGSVRICGSTASEPYRKIAAQSSVNKHKWYANANNPLFFFLCEDGGSRSLVLLELDERIIDAVRRSKQLAGGAWQDKEGKSNSYAGLSR